MSLLTRREMLRRTGEAATILAAGLPAQEAARRIQPTPKVIGRRLKVVVTGGHPGDPEYGCGGTIARYVNRGDEVVLLYLNNGEWPAAKGGAPASTRMAEARKACRILQARPAYAAQTNGNAIVDSSHFDEYRRILEAERPDVVFTQWPIDAHRDHRAASTLTFDAWLKMGRKFALYYYEVSNGEDTLQFSPTHYVDITATEPVKRASCYAHASQTPDKFYALQDQVAKFRGIENGCERAEAFILQVESPYDALPVAI